MTAPWSRGKCRPLERPNGPRSEIMETLFHIALDVLIVAGFWWARPRVSEMAEASLATWDN